MDTVRTRPAAPSLNAGAAALFSVLLVIDSLHYIWARLLSEHIGPMPAAFFVLAVGAVEVAVLGLPTGALRWQPARAHLVFFGAVGALVAAATAFSYSAMRYIDPGAASMLAKLGTVFTLLFGVFYLRERLSRGQLGGAALAVAGAFVIAFQPGDLVQTGALMVIISTLLYALHAALVKRYGDGIDFVNFFFYRLLSTAVFMWLFTAAAGQMEWPQTPRLWLLLLVVGTVDVTLSRALYYVAMRRMTLSLHTILLTLSPVLSVLWALLVFDILPGPQQFVGGLCVLAGVLIATRR